MDVSTNWKEEKRERKREKILKPLLREQTKVEKLLTTRIFGNTILNGLPIKYIALVASKQISF